METEKMSMKLKTRLIIGFVTVILLPVALSVIVLWGYSQYHFATFEKTYGIQGADYGVISNPVNILNQMTQTIYQELKSVAAVDSEQMFDIMYLGKVNQELESMNSYLIVRSEGNLIYAGSDEASQICDSLPGYGEEYSSSENGTYIGGKSQVLIKQIDFVGKDEKKGSLFLITDVGTSIPEARKVLTDMVFAVVMILVLTAGILIFWIYRGVNLPLSEMKIAAQNIKDGNLDYELEIVTDDEIGQLARDFEEMRLTLKESAAEKMEYDRRSKELISNISHDLKTPITAIKGYVEGIMDGVADTPEKMDRYIRTIYNKANEMDLLINELTLYSKIDSNRIPYNFNTIAVNEYFDDCAMDLKMELEAGGIEFDYLNYVEKDVKIIADAEQLKRVVNNIVSNSKKYMDKTKKKIHLRVKDVGDFIQVEIEDNGKGMGTKELPHIFERFYRTDASRNSSTGGSGIGLSIVKKIIEEHGGKIWATSKEGTGTVMYFVIRKYQEGPLNE